MAVQFGCLQGRGLPTERRLVVRQGQNGRALARGYESRSVVVHHLWFWSRGRRFDSCRDYTSSTVEY